MLGPTLIIKTACPLSHALVSGLLSGRVVEIAFVEPFSAGVVEQVADSDNEYTFHQICSTSSELSRSLGWELVARNQGIIFRSTGQRCDHRSRYGDGCGDDHIRDEHLTEDCGHG